jgi:F420H(2)-dependent quinone reductase
MANVSQQRQRSHRARQRHPHGAPKDSPTSTRPTETNDIERQLFRALNRVVEPVVRAGMGNTLAGPGTFVIETTGRRSGLPWRVPLLARRIGDTIIVSTIRNRSQWIRNLEHDPNAHAWIAGRPRPVTATIVRLPRATLARLRLETSAPHASNADSVCSARHRATSRA